MDSIFQDLRFAFRSLAKAPGFTAAVVLTLALGIGANTAIFSLINSLLLRDLPVRDPDRLIVLRTENPAALSYPAWDYLRRQRQLFDGTFAYGFSRFNLAQGGESDPVEGMWVSGEFFRTLVAPSLGRAITDADDRRGGGPSGAVAVISHRFWQQRFGGAADVTVMELLRELHRAGATLCMVTHDPRYARHADRTIHLFDGQIVDEQTAERLAQDSGFDLRRSPVVPTETRSGVRES